MKKIIMTLTLIRDKDKILLALKKRGFGMGRWNGFGGKIEVGESLEEAAQRETFEESNLAVKNLEPVAVIDFSWQNKPEQIEMHVFKATDFSGELQESEEMKPAWFTLAEIPYDKMWSDDKYWLPLFLQDKKFTAEFVFDDHDKIVEHEIKIETP
jgi:ADP-ribose pyrophosphatase YjhB (NUDIX family)